MKQLGGDTWHPRRRSDPNSRRLAEHPPRQSANRLQAPQPLSAIRWRARIRRCQFSSSYHISGKAWSLMFPKENRFVPSIIAEQQYTSPMALTEQISLVKTGKSPPDQSIQSGGDYITT